MSRKLAYASPRSQEPHGTLKKSLFFPAGRRKPGRTASILCAALTVDSEIFLPPIMKS